MESTANNIFVDSCQYTPVYFLEDPSITQAKSYVVTQNITNIQKPVSDNLKKFYENSGKLENNLHVTETNTKPRILKKYDNNVVGNNLKLASFLLPKSEPSNCGKQMTMQNNVLLKPVYIANTPNIVNAVPKLDVNSKIVQLKEMPNITRTSNGKIVPKIKAKETTSNSKHTSVQLLKLGQTYHSLNQLSEEQMKIVNHALKIFSNPKDPPQKPTYDPVTNTKFIYKVVSPKDLTVVGKNDLLINEKKTEVLGKNDLFLAQKKPELIVGKNDLFLAQKKPELVVGKKELFLNQKNPECVVGKNDILITQKTPELKKIVKKIDRKEQLESGQTKSNVKIPIFLENAVTRSGRKVRISKNILQEEIANKPKKKIAYVVSCNHCSSKFSSVYRLQRHYDFHPSHAPDRVHSNLFQCFLGIIKGGSKENSVNVFIDQLEHFISKLRSCIPCLVKADDDCTGDHSSFITENISRLLGISPGKYNVNIDGLECEKDQNGFCEHNPPPHQFNEPTIWLNEPTEVPKEFDNAETNKNVKLPSKRVEPRKYKCEQYTNVKKLKVNPSDEASSITTDDIVSLLSDTLKTENIMETNTKIIEQCNEQKVNNETVFEQPKAFNIPFRSTHFDIRSSPIKPSTNTFSKFQINTENMSKYKVHIIRPLQISQMPSEIATDIDNATSLQTQFLKENVEVNDFNGLEQLNDILPKNWTHEETNHLLKPNSITDEANNVIQPNLIHIKDNTNCEQSQLYENEITIPDQILTDQEHSMDALNFLETLGNECIYPETEIRNNSVDFHLDLFSFNNT